MADENIDFADYPVFFIDFADFEDDEEEENLALTDEEIGAIPMTTEVPRDEVCAICLEGFVGPARVLPCNHHFHDMCITPWLTAHSTCPVCRYQLEGSRHVNHERFFDSFDQLDEIESLHESTDEFEIEQESSDEFELEEYNMEVTFSSESEAWGDISSEHDNIVVNWKMTSSHEDSDVSSVVNSSSSESSSAEIMEEDSESSDDDFVYLPMRYFVHARRPIRNAGQIVVTVSPTDQTQNAAVMEIPERHSPSPTHDNSFYTEYSTPPSRNTRSSHRNRFREENQERSRSPLDRSAKSQSQNESRRSRR